MAYEIGNRGQMTFLPPVIDDFIGPEDPVRVYDAFVGALDLNDLGIPLQPYKAGAHEYHPRAMLKLIIYGYSYGIRSSRRLERACNHNLSFIWLTGNLKPDYRTIATSYRHGVTRFRSNHKEAIKRVLKQTVRLCVELGLIEGNTLFIDGSNFRANASIENTWTKERCEKYLQKISKDIDRLVDEAEGIDQQEEAQGSLVKLKNKILGQKEIESKIKEIADTLKSSEKTSVNATDPDCVKAKGRQGTHASYKAQLTVDEKHGLIVHSEAVSQNNDLNQLHTQLSHASEALGANPEAVCSDSGYFSLKDLKEIPKDITVIIPNRRQAQEENKIHPIRPFSKEEFKYDSEEDEYECPEGKRLKYRGTALSDPQKMTYKAEGRDCRACSHFGICTTSKYGRKVIRMVDEALKNQLEETYQSPQGREIYKLRKQKVELPFGHMKRNLGAGQFLVRGKEGVNAELSILSTCFNVARMMTLIGIPLLIQKLSGI
ncbi:MAG: IS1182 family transposase [Candidatus Brocadiales bacterium]